jgi:hypothetical protein
MGRRKKSDEYEEEESVSTIIDDSEDEVDPEEAALAAEKRKAIMEEKITLSKKRRMKAEKELESITTGTGISEEVMTESGRASYLSDFKNDLNTHEGWKVYIERSRPRKFKGVDLPRNVCQFETPIDFEEIESDLEQTYGGGSYKLTLKDDDYKFRGRRQITIHADPKIPEGNDEDSDDDTLSLLGRRGLRFGPGIDEEDDPLDEEAKLKKEIRVAQLQKQLQRIAGEEDPKESVQELIQNALSEQREMYEKKFEELHRRQELQDLVGPLREEIIRLKEDRNRPSGDSDELKLLREQMAADREKHKEEMSRIREERLRSESQAQMELLRAQFEEVKNGKGNAADPTMALMMKALDNMGSKSDAQISMISGGMTEMMKGQVAQWQSMVNKMMEQKDPGSKTSELRELAETMMAINGVFGGNGEEPKDLPTALLSAVEKIVPQVLGEMKEGRQMMAGATEENMMKLAARMTEEIKGEVRAQLSGSNGSPGGGPAPVAPPSHSEPVGSNTPQRPSSSSPTPPGVPSVPEERRQRVNLVLDYILRDMEILPGTPQWPYAAWQVFPGDIRMAIVRAQSDEDVYNSIKGEGDIAKLEKLWSYIKEKGEHRSFLIKGINQIKKWHKEGGPPDVSTGTAGAESPATP